MHSQALMVQTLSQLSAKEVAELVATLPAHDDNDRRHVQFASLAAGDCLLLPGGCMVVERTAKQMTIGLRHTVLPNSEEAAAEVDIYLKRCSNALASFGLLFVATHTLAMRRAQRGSE